MPHVPPRKSKAPTTFIEPMNEVAVNPIPDVPKGERVLGTKYALRAVDGRFKATLVTPGRVQRHVTDRAIVATKDTFSRLQNDALDQGEKSIQYYGKQLGKMSRYCS